MLHNQHKSTPQGLPDSKVLQNQPTSSADSAIEDMAAEADEPPDIASWPLFPKAPCSAKVVPSLLSRMIHTSESDSHVDEDDYAYSSYEPHRTTSSASTYSRGSAVSMTESMADTAVTSPHSTSPPVVFKQPSFQAVAPKNDGQAPSMNSDLESVAEQKPEVAFLKKRCISFACGSKAPKERLEKAVEVRTAVPAPAAAPTEQKRVCRLKFVCPSRNSAEKSKPHVRLSSPPPRVRTPAPTSIRQHRDSDATLRTNSPKLVKKMSPITPRVRRGSTASNASRVSAMRFHEFASSEEEVDDWVKEKTCYQRRLTIDDTLAKENNLRKLGEEVDDEEEDEDDVDDEDVLDDDEDEDEDDEDVLDDDEDEDDDEDDEELHNRRSAMAGAPEEMDEGFQTDDELGFAHSDDDDDANSDYDWWAPGRSLGTERNSNIRPRASSRRGSDSSIESQAMSDRGIAISPHLQRKRSKASGRERANNIELPDSTDFVCGTLDEDRPLEQAFFNHLQQRRAAKHKLTPQDIDPTFPTSDPEIDEEEDEDSEHHATESDAHLFVHGEMDEEDRSRRGVTKKRSPAPSPKRIRSPAPLKRVTTRAKSPAPLARRARSPAPCAFDNRRLSSSVPRRGSLSQMRERFEETIYEEDDNTPRFNRQAVDIVMGLERKRARRREKLYEKHCRKAAKTKEKKTVKPGKGAERMRDLGIGLNEYRGGKHITPQQSQTGEVHMLSY